MSKNIYCTEKTKGSKREAVIAENHIDKVSSKRVNIVSIKMIKESSILYEGRKISSPSDGAEIGRRFLEDIDREALVVCCLDTKNQPTAISMVSLGSLNASIVHPREVYKVAILSNAASILLFHNHPSGDPLFSEEDRNITIRLKECGKLIGIELIDHIIIGEDNRYCSMKEKGII